MELREQPVEANGHGAGHKRQYDGDPDTGDYGQASKTVDSGASRTDHGDDTNVTPTTAVCSACHDTDLAKTHMVQNGGAFTMSGDPGSYSETCAVCHGPGRTADIAEVHAIAP